MPIQDKMAKTIILAGIPFLAFPFLAESGMSGERSQRGDGGRSFSDQQIVKGEISKKNGDEITIRSSSGEKISFRINDQTNELCPNGTQKSHTSSMGKNSSMNQDSSMSQGSSTENSSGQTSSGQGQIAQDTSGSGSSESGQSSSSSLFGNQGSQVSGHNSGQGSSGVQNNSQSLPGGFRFGECNFQKGEFVKAKIDENGNATFVRSMGNSDEYYGTSGAGGEYFVLPAGQLGGLDISDKDAHYSVQSSDGQEIGSVYRVMTNNDGDLTYAIVRKTDGQLISVPWQALEGSGNKTFKLKVTQNQLGNLPILKEGESAGAHVQKNWDLTQQERQRLAKWNERLDDFNQTRDRYYEDTPTFHGNRDGYDRYDYDRGRNSRADMNRSQGDRQRQYQDQRFDDSQSKHYGFSPTEFPPPNRAPQYEGDQGRSFDRNRQGRSSDDFRNRGDQRSMYSQSRERNYYDAGDGSDRYQTTTPRSQYYSQGQGADRQSRRSGIKDYDYRPEGYRP